MYQGLLSTVKIKQAYNKNYFIVFKSNYFISIMKIIQIIKVIKKIECNENWEKECDKKCKMGQKLKKYWVDCSKSIFKGMLCAVKKRFKIPILTIKLMKYIL